MRLLSSLQIDLSTAPVPRLHLLPTIKPTNSPSNEPTDAPSHAPTSKPTFNPTISPTLTPTIKPTLNPTNEPSKAPSSSPTAPLLITGECENTCLKPVAVSACQLNPVIQYRHAMLTPIGALCQGDGQCGTDDVDASNLNNNNCGSLAIYQQVECIIPTDTPTFTHTTQPTEHPTPSPTKKPSSPVIIIINSGAEQVKQVTFWIHLDLSCGIGPALL